MRKFYSYLVVLALMAVSTMARAQYEVFLEQSPIDDYSTVTASLSLTDLSSALNMTIETLQERLTEDGMVEILQEDGTYMSGKTTDENNGFWMTEEGFPTNYNNYSAWFLYVTAENGNAVFHVGQYPGVFADIDESRLLTTMLSMCNAENRITIVVNYKVKAANEEEGTPTEWTRPVPKFVPMDDSGATIQYLYNVEYGGFFLGANNWNTRASISKEKGYQVQVSYRGYDFYYDYDYYNEEGEYVTWSIMDFDETQNAWLNLFCQGWNQLWVDYNDQGNDCRYGWVLKELGDNTYEITYPYKGGR